MLLDGEIDAAILGDVAEEGPIRHLIPDHEAAGRAWARKHGGAPINHLTVMRESLVKSRPDVVREVYRVLKESREAAAELPTGADDPTRFGIGRVRQSLEQLISYAVQQKLIPRHLSVDALFEDSARILDSAGA
jgi:4,5-dihydroxyphthalate decarboxylase